MKFLRKLLVPFSPLYYGVTWIRNFLYDIGFLKSKSFPFPVIAVGNLSVGGTGKSPMTEFLISLLKDHYPISVLSRGYKRKSKGFIQVQTNSTVNEVGDEPLQMKIKYPEVTVAVDRDRCHGIDQLRMLVPQPEVILLDDAFQHRKVTAGFYILLTAYGDLYIDDMLLPAGNLREPVAGATRANVIIVTKCPEYITIQEKNKIRKKLDIKSHQTLYFTTIKYDETLKNNNREITLSFLQGKKFTLVTGIANPKPLVDYLVAKGLVFEHKNFSDHHNFSTSEIADLRKKELIVTTEKDYTRLQSHLGNNQIYYLQIQKSFLEDGAIFENQILQYIDKNLK